MTQATEKPARANYDAAIILFSAALFIVAIGGGVYLLSLAVGAAPVVATIFGVLLVLTCIAFGIALFLAVRWFVHRISEVTANTARDMSAALMSYKSQQPQIAAPMVYAEPARAQIADIRRTFNNGLPPGVSGARVSDGSNEYIASTPSLIAALDLLAEGRDPTRSNFREKGIMSSTEVAGAVNLLASLGYVSPVVQGAPAEWADGVAPANVAAIADHLRGYVPALPVYQPVFAETPQQAGQAGSKAGRGGAKRR
jgi:hypothetical protein